jgi:FlaG/FlaF family flagellin (archaellin)
MYKNGQKGLSQMIAAVLLVAFTVTIATLISGWYSTLIRTTSSNISNTTEEAIDCTVAKITIEDVYLDTTANTVNVVVRNTGMMDNLQLTSATVLNTTGGACTYDSGLDTDFDKGDVATIKFISCSISSCSVFKEAIVLTNCGGVSDTYDGTPTNC